MAVKEKLSWQELFHAAMLELDRTRLPGRIEEARAMIRIRIEELRRNAANARHPEEHTLDDALRSLRVLERTEFRRPIQNTTTAGPSSPGEGS